MELFSWCIWNTGPPLSCIITKGIWMVSFTLIFKRSVDTLQYHYNDVIKSAMASQISSLTIANSTVYSGADQRKHQSSTTLAFVRGIHRWPVNSPNKGPVTRKMAPFDDVIMPKTVRPSILTTFVLFANPRRGKPILNDSWSVNLTPCWMLFFLLFIHKCSHISMTSFHE